MANKTLTSTLEKTHRTSSQGDTFIGGSISTTTRELWEVHTNRRTKGAACCWNANRPANVAIPADGEFARQWYYDQQDAETQALLDSGELEYPEHFAAATFTDTFALGDNTNINLNRTAVSFKGGSPRHSGGSAAIHKNLFLRTFRYWRICRRVEPRCWFFHH